MEGGKGGKEREREREGNDRKNVMGGEHVWGGRERKTVGEGSRELVNERGYVRLVSGG